MCNRNRLWPMTFLSETKKNIYQKKFYSITSLMKKSYDMLTHSSQDTSTTRLQDGALELGNF